MLRPEQHRPGEDVEAALVALDLVTSSRASDCPGCMGRSTCWVCQGFGTLVRRGGDSYTCTTCYGGRLCSVCQPVPAQREGGSPAGG